MGRVIVQITVANNQDIQMAERGALPADQIRKVQVSALVDMGANWLVLPETVAAQLGLPKVQSAMVRFAENRMEFRDMVGQADVELLGRHGTFKAIVEPNRNDAIVGAIVLEDLDLLVDCTAQTLHPRDPDRFVAEIGW
jgi:predicted aspartyl protease